MMKVSSGPLIVALILGCALGAPAQSQPEFKSVAGMQLQNVPGLPECIKGAPAHGDPAGGAFILYAKAAAGCTIPTHWHSANEQLIGISGSGRLTHEGAAKAETLQKGGFVYLPAKHPHALTCTTACEFYVISDGKFDIHYVDKSGKEISPDQALKSGAGGASGKRAPVANKTGSGAEEHNH